MSKDKARENVTPIPPPHRKAITPEQAKRRREVDARNAALQAVKIPEPKSGVFGRLPKSKP